MSDNKKHQNEAENVEQVNEEIQQPVIDDVEPTDSEETTETLESQILNLNEQLEKEKKEYLFLMAEFDNFRKRTLKEKSELLRNAGENVLKGILPILDDFERGLKALADNPEADTQGMTLIYNKLKKYLEQNGVKEMPTDGEMFDADRHEAISAVPAADPEQKGKILDTLEKGYTINDKVLRHAKVVVAQ